MRNRVKINGQQNRIRCWRTRVVPLLILSILMGIGGSPYRLEASEAKPSTRMIVDRIGREVRIPDRPERIACLFGPSYEKVFALGGGSRVVMVPKIILPWNYVLNPGLKKVQVMGNFTAPNVEELLQLKADLVIYHPFIKQIDRLSASGLPVVVAYDGNERQMTLESFIKDWYEQIRFYGELLGGRANEIADEYCAYVDEKLRKVIGVTSKIPANERPTVFYVCGRIEGNSNTQTMFSTAYWLVDAAGGRMLTYDEKPYFVTVSTEQIMAWNPDIIVVGTSPSIDSIVNDPRLKGINAVKERQVFISPEGLFYWSHFSSESFLCVLYLAKLFHPDLFAEVDVKQELKTYYANFFHYNLTDDQAERILKHLPPKTASQP